jgi:signal transduction histidine kinase
MFTAAVVAGHAGPALPLVYLFSLVGVLLLVNTIAEFSRRLAHAGSFYAFNTAGLGPMFGFFAGWLLFAAYPLPAEPPRLRSLRVGGAREPTRDPHCVVGLHGRRRGDDLGTLTARHQCLDQDHPSLQIFGILAVSAVIAAIFVKGGATGANAKARQDLAMVAEEQAALRWIATLVARGALPEPVSSAVAEELGRLFGADAAYVMLDERDGTVVAVGGWSREGLELSIAVGHRIPTTAMGIAGRVLRTGMAARAEYFDASPDSLSALLRDAGIVVAVASPLRVQDRAFGLVVMASRAADAFPADVERRLEAFADLVAIAVVNAQGRAEVAASRARVVASGDEARRQIGRDLHDGAQQRLVSLALDLRVAQDLVPPGCGELAEQLDSVATQLIGAMEELRDFVRGIHPPALEYGGLESALRALARRSPVPVQLTADVHDRLPKSLATNAYFIVAEALTNAAKHARASASQVEVRAEDGVLRLAVSDDGVGGADPAAGSGLLGLRDRVEAVAGTMTVRSPRGEGTVLLVQMPLSAERAAEAGGPPQS